MSLELKEFIKNHRDDINSQLFEKIYNELNLSSLPLVDIGKFTELLYACGIDPLMYMSKIPRSYAYQSKFQSIIIPNNITRIGNEAFSGCASLTSITIPDSVMDIGNSIFSGCTSLSSVNIGKGVKNIPSFAFYYCISLTHITIPDNVISISYEAFYNCSSLASIAIGKGITGIGERTFYNCKSLDSITIPSSVTAIGNGAFNGCTSLANIKFTGTMAQWDAVYKDGPILGYSAPTRVIHCSDGDMNL